jgi:TonB family protein
MKAFTILIITVLPSILYAQGDTVYKGNFFKSSIDTNSSYRVITKHDSTWVKQDFYTKNNQLKTSAVFRDSFYAIRTGFFTRYLIDGTLVDSLRFDNNILKEAWYFHDNGNKSAYEVYENYKLIKNTNWDEQGREMDKNYKDTVFKTNYASWKDYLEVSYDRNQPKAYKKGKIYGKVFIEYTIDKYGYITDAKVKLSSGYPELDEHALNIIKNGPRFTTPRQHGRRITYKAMQQFNYPSLKELLND